jgi:hypothetical protein
MKLAGQRSLTQLTPRAIRRIDGSGFAIDAPPRPTVEGNLMAQLSVQQRAAVQNITDDPEMSEIDKMWSITEAVLGGLSERTND